MKFLIAGLGNPGQQYALTRHNIGFLALDQLADQEQKEFTLTRHAEKTEFKSQGKTLHLIKPQTFMNASGKAVAYWLQELKIPRENLLVVVDDLALPFGTFRLRTKGSSAGHNGLNDIEQVLGTQEYSRLRLGIGNSFHKGDQVNFVLGNFDQQEMDHLLPFLKEACEVVRSFCAIGPERTMNIYNQKKK